MPISPCNLIWSATIVLLIRLVISPHQSGPRSHTMSRTGINRRTSSQTHQLCLGHNQYSSSTSHNILGCVDDQSPGIGKTSRLL
ncbi:hypothetical protein BDP55DRAFT_257426 [Colletotrichum godetiae]|uniref:Secreted protein n=1 Tax=Colletotrichum godetiae TaxID=1209918 RepID=A0AAJ0AVL1_9PEZI|nr:uncharacterized protein BDP55DRAFT_257426 [Colletotrichum godetiae]KAK1691191.1 hypothetical protein BDP55DRAFT_257426 [Colletotrichum godetiae]